MREFKIEIKDFIENEMYIISRMKEVAKEMVTVGGDIEVEDAIEFFLTEAGQSDILDQGYFKEWVSEKAYDKTPITSSNSFYTAIGDLDGIQNHVENMIEEAAKTAQSELTEMLYPMYK